MKGPAELLANEGRWETRMGLSFPGERVVFRGKDLHAELGDMSWMELYLYGVTGRRFSENELKILSAIWVYTSYPDPRVWNNRVVSLAGTARSSGALGVAGGIAVSEATIYGGRPFIRSIEFLFRAGRLVNKGGRELGAIITDEIESGRYIYGYGRPLNIPDERIAPFTKLVAAVGMDQGQHYLLAFDIERILLLRNANLRMNIAALYSAVAADMQFSPREYHLFMIPCFMAGMLPCLVEAETRPEGTCLPLGCHHVAYSGPTKRRWTIAE